MVYEHIITLIVSFGLEKHLEMKNLSTLDVLSSKQVSQDQENNDRIASSCNIQQINTNNLTGLQFTSDLDILLLSQVHQLSAMEYKFEDDELKQSKTFVYLGMKIKDKNKKARKIVEK